MLRGVQAVQSDPPSPRWFLLLQLKEAVLLVGIREFHLDVYVGHDVDRKYGRTDLTHVINEVVCRPWRDASRSVGDAAAVRVSQ